MFSEGHVLLYNSDINTQYEFNYGGFRGTLAPQREMKLYAISGGCANSTKTTTGFCPLT